MSHSILIIDSNDMARLGLEHLALECGALRVVGSADCLSSGLRLIRERRPDLVVTEMALRDASGPETIRSVVTTQQPRSTLVVSAHHELLFGEQALALGADGYLMKQSAQANVITAMLAILAGQRWISPALNAHLVERTLQRRRGGPASAEAPLTARELDVLDQLKTGRSTNEIAASLRISPRTVDLHRSNIKKKLHLRSGAELIAFASQQA